MLITTHAIASAGIASVIPYPAISIPLAFAGHFVLDKIPHWPDKSTREKLSKYIYTIVVVDLIVALIVTAWLVKATSNQAIAWAAFIGSIMDIDAVFYHKKFIDIFKTPLPKPLSRLHGGVQNETGSIWGVVTQLAIIFVALYLILNYA